MRVHRLSFSLSGPASLFLAVFITVFITVFVALKVACYCLADMSLFAHIPQALLTLGPLLPKRDLLSPIFYGLMQDILSTTDGLQVILLRRWDFLNDMDYEVK